MKTELTIREQGAAVPAIGRYGMALLSVAAAYVAAKPLQAHYNFEPLVAFICAMMWSAWFGGFKPGLLTLALSLVVFHFCFLVPVYSGNVGKEIPRLVLAALTSFFVVWLTASQRSAMEALRRSELRFRRLVEAMPVAVYVCDKSGIIQSYNKQAVELWGREPKLGDTSECYCGSLRLYSTDGKPLAHEKSKMEEVLRTGVQARDWEVVVERPDGSRITALANISPLRNDQGELIGAVNCVQDITERKRAEDLLGESRQLLHLVLATLPVGVAVTDRNGDIVLANAASKRIWGDTIVSGRDRWAQSKGFWHDTGKRIGPSDWPSIRALSEGQTNVNDLIDIETFDGQKKTIQNSAAPIRNTEGLIVGAVFVNEDVTERVEAEDALKKAEDNLRFVLDTTPAMIHTARPDGHLDYFNKRWLEYVGVPMENLLGWGWTAFIHPDDIEGEVNRWRACVASGEPFECEVRTRRADGKYRWVLHRKVAMRDEHGDIVKWCGSAMDIHDLKQAEHMLRDSQSQLRALSARLQSAREEEAARIAREIHDDLGQKLTALRMDLLRAERKIEGLERSQPVNALLDTIVSATELVDSITASVQEIAANLRPAMLDKLGLGAALQYESRRFQERAGILCEAHLPETEPHLSAEVSTALFRIFQECLTNVARHADATKIEAQLGVEGGFAILRLRDDGRGITEADMAKPRSLGLLGIKERVALLGGDVAYQSCPNQGTVVTVRVPMNGTAQKGED